MLDEASIDYNFFFRWYPEFCWGVCSKQCYYFGVQSRKDSRALILKTIHRITSWTAIASIDDGKKFLFACWSFEEDLVSHATFLFGNSQSWDQNFFRRFQLGLHHYEPGENVLQNKHQLFSSGFGQFS